MGRKAVLLLTVGTVHTVTRWTVIKSGSKFKSSIFNVHMVIDVKRILRLQRTSRSHEFVGAWTLGDRASRTHRHTHSHT